MAITFPSTKQAEVKNWIQIQAFEHDPNMTQQEGPDSYGTAVGGTMHIVAPQSIVENNTQQYSSADFKLSSAIAGMGKGFDWVNAAIVAGALALKALPGVGEEASRYFGTTVNPRSEQLYSAPGYRTWTFHWELAPLSKDDDGNIKKIISRIRKSSYPSLAKERMLYKMPHEFKVKLINDVGGTISDIEPKFGKCVCTNVGVNYTGAGVNVVSSASFSPFINLDITMVERILLHQGSAPIN